MKFFGKPMSRATTTQILHCQNKYADLLIADIAALDGSSIARTALCFSVVDQDQIVGFTDRMDSQFPASRRRFAWRTIRKVKFREMHGANDMPICYETIRQRSQSMRTGIRNSIDPAVGSCHGQHAILGVFDAKQCALRHGGTRDKFAARPNWHRWLRARSLWPGL